MGGSPPAIGCRTRPHAAVGPAARLVVCWVAGTWSAARAAPFEPPPALTPIAAVRSSPRDTLARNPPVRVRAVVTRSTESSLFVQDETAGIYVNIARAIIRGVMPRDPPLSEVPLAAEVEIDGVADPGGYSPIILPRAITVLGPGTLPAPRPFDPATFFTGADDSQFVEVSGVVQEALETTTHWRLSLEVLGRPFLASLAKEAVAGDPREMVDAEVVVRGPTSSMSNTRREFLVPWVFVERRDWWRVVRPPPAADAGESVVGLADVARFNPSAREGRRVRTVGTVIHVVADADVFLQDGAWGIRASTRDTSDVRPGDRVEAAGFPSRDGHVAGLAHATLRRLERGPPPEPIDILPEEINAVNERAVATQVLASPGDYVGCLVRFPARLVDRHADYRDTLLVLSTGSTTVVARCPVDAAALASPALGSLVEVTGIVSLDWEFDPLNWPRQLPRSITLTMRSPADLRVLEPAPFWTPRRLLAALGINAAALGMVAAWAWGLRRRRAELESLVTARTRELVVAREHEKQLEDETRVLLEKKLRSSLSAAAIAHEINQPLSRILLRCRLGQHAPGEDGRAAAGLDGFAAVAADAERVVTTIEKMKVLLRNVQTAHAEIDLAQVARSSLFQVKQLLKDHDVEASQILPAGGCRMHGDDVQLQLALVNLLRNAIEAIAAAGASRREIQLTVADAPGGAMVEVADSGPGWPGGTLDESLLATTKPAGTGVGLFVVRTTVENHGGTLEIAPTPLGGAAFRLTFPRIDASGPGRSAG